MKTTQDPKENSFKVATKSALIGRLPRKEGDRFKTAVIRLFSVNNPHKTTEFPTQTFEFSNIEKIKIRRLGISYYLEGNDIVINDMEEIYIKKEDSKLVVSGYQFCLESDDEI